LVLPALAALLLATLVWAILLAAPSRVLLLLAAALSLPAAALLTAALAGVLVALAALILIRHSLNSLCAAPSRVTAHRHLCSSVSA
jgi:hypothetical protein